MALITTRDLRTGCRPESRRNRGSNNRVDRAWRVMPFCRKLRSSGLQSRNSAHQPPQAGTRHSRARASMAAP